MRKYDSRTETLASSASVDTDASISRRVPRQTSSRERTKRRRDRSRLFELQTEIFALRRRIDGLNDQKKTCYTNRVSKSEMCRFRAEIQAFRSDANGTTISRIISEYTDVMMERMAAKQACEFMTSEINRERLERSARSQERFEAISLLDMAELGIAMPKLQIPASGGSEIRKLESQLTRVYNAVAECSSDKHLMSVQSAAALEVVKLSTAESRRSQKDRSVIEASTISLKEIVRTGDCEVKRLNEEKRQIEERARQGGNDSERLMMEVKRAQREQELKASAEIRVLEEETEKIKDMISSTSRQYDYICNDIDRIMRMEVDDVGAWNEDEDDEASEVSFPGEDDDDGTIIMNSTTETRMRDECDGLAAEVDELQRKYSAQKQKKQARENGIRDAIQRLYATLRSNQAMIRTLNDAVVRMSMSSGSDIMCRFDSPPEVRLSESF